MMSRLFCLMLPAMLVTFALVTSADAQPQPQPPPPLPKDPMAIPPKVPEPESPLTPQQQAAVRKLIEQVIGVPQPMGSPVPIPTPPPIANVPFPPPPPTTFHTVGQPIGPSGAPPRFAFKIDPKAPLSELLPAAPKTPSKLPMWSNEDLTKVAELSFSDPMPKELNKKDLNKVEAMKLIAHGMAKVNHLNRQKSDGFMLALLDNRGDLRGLPFLMGDECKTREEAARTFREMADIVNQFVVQCKNGVPQGNPPPMPSGPLPASFRNDEQLWAGMANVNSLIQRGAIKSSGFVITSSNKDQINRAMVAALMQILMPEGESYRLGLAKFLGTVPHPDATKALARLALYSPEDAIRSAAIDNLKLRREKDYTDILLQGFTYPLPAVSKRAAEALIKLERVDLVENLVQVLESPDPRLPATKKQDGKDVTFVRELVKVNHHRNCVLCHAPGNTEGIPEGVLTVAVPLPVEPLPKPSQGGYQSTPPASPDILVRLDMTYLRQDFSLMMPVANPEPWPELQRFDFLVRTRTLTATEAQAYEECCPEDEPGRLSPYHRSALFALRELTGRDTEPTAGAWRKLLKLSKKSG